MPRCYRSTTLLSKAIVAGLRKTSCDKFSSCLEGHLLHNPLHILLQIQSDGFMLCTNLVFAFQMRQLHTANNLFSARIPANNYALFIIQQYAITVCGASMSCTCCCRRKNCRPGCRWRANNCRPKCCEPFSEESHSLYLSWQWLGLLVITAQKKIHVLRPIFITSSTMKETGCCVEAAKPATASVFSQRPTIYTEPTHGTANYDAERLLLHLNTPPVHQPIFCKSVQLSDACSLLWC